VFHVLNPWILRVASLPWMIGPVPAKLVVQGLVTTAVAVALVPAGPVSSASASSDRLAFDLPAKSTLRHSGRKVFAHYMPSMPLSFDNQRASVDYWTRHYLNPRGEHGIHAAYGGFVRDRPRGRAVRPEASWKLLDMKMEVRQAIRAGIDGFSVDLLSLNSGSRNLANTKRLLRAAHLTDPGFKIMLVPDMTTSVGRKTPTQLASSLSRLAASPAAYRLSGGRLVVSPFKAEVHSAAWWKSFLSKMRSAHGIRVAFVPTFLDERPYLRSFAPISYGMSNWGSRNPRANNPSATAASSPVGRARAVRARGLLWMQPVGYQDERPRSGKFDEAQNTRNLRAGWHVALRSGAKWVQLTTWNDYAEGSQIAPSAKHGFVPLDISSYYLTRFKTGSYPRVRRDVVYVTHRRQFWAAKPRFGQTVLMRLSGATPARNKVEAFTLLRAPGTVSITVGGRKTSCRVPRGAGVCTASLRAGKVSAKVTRAGVLRASVTSTFTVTSSPYVQDLQYLSVGSLRQGYTRP
jgi:hypothetical protein